MAVAGAEADAVFVATPLRVCRMLIVARTEALALALSMTEAAATIDP